MSEFDTPSHTTNKAPDDAAAAGGRSSSHELLDVAPAGNAPLPQQPPPPPAPPAPLRSSVVRTPEFTSSGTAASPSLSSINTTPRQGSSKRYLTHHGPLGSTFGDRKIQPQQHSTKAASIFSSTRENNDLLHSRTDNPLSGIQYPHLLVSTTKLKPISQCTVLSCFYAEFDNTVGPKICYQYPPNFMSDLDIQSTTKQLEDALQAALFESAINENQETALDTECATADTESSTLNEDLQHQNVDEITGISSSGETPKASGGRSVATAESESTTTETTTGSSKAVDVSLKNSRPGNNNGASASCGNTSSIESASSTIFDSCCEYIITGRELAGNIINVSTHNIHLLSRPTILIDEDNYERNTLLFSIGFVLRRKMDPQPYKAILSKLVLTIRDMEIESQFISQRKDQIQSMLEGIVRSMNSYNTNGECNILLGPADVLHFQLFRPPRPHVRPVNDYSVPVLVRRDWLYQGYEWDLSINWVSLHIDGIANAKQISKRAEVDLEMVRACLRVLIQHNVVHLVDMFCYSNRYECTGLKIGPDMLHDAVEYVIKRTELRLAPTTNDNEMHAGSLTKSDSEAVSMLDASYGDVSQPTDAEMMRRTCLSSSSLPNNDAGASLLASSIMKHEDHLEVQNAIIEFYATCHRDIPIGEVWIALITKRQPTTHVTSTMSSSVSWKKVFRLIDHRRLVTFGLIHGYIRRVHNFPLLVKRNNNAMDDDVSTPKYINNILLPTSSSSHNRIGRGSSHNSSSHNIKNEQKLRRIQSKRLAETLMDGMHCEDEIVCTAELPLDEILTLFPENSVVSVFAPGY